jgi:hypothetical protein
MRSTRNFHPEWGYLAPSANFIRTARISLIAVVVGGIAGASIVLPLVDRPADEISVAARTLSRPGEDASVPVGTARTPVKMQAAIQDQTVKPQPMNPAPMDGSRMASESSARLTAQPPTSGAVGAEVPASAASPADAGSYQGPAPVQKKATRKPHPTLRYASRGERLKGDRGSRRPFDDQSLFSANVPAEYYPRRGYGGYYRVQRWGDYYPNGGFDYR